MKRIRHCAQGVWCSLAVTSSRSSPPWNSISSTFAQGGWLGCSPSFLLIRPLSSAARSGRHSSWRLGLCTPATPSGPPLPGLKSPPPSGEVRLGCLYLAAPPASPLVRGLAAQKPQLYLKSPRAATVPSAPRAPHAAADWQPKGAGARWPGRSMGGAGQARREENEHRVIDDGVEGRRGEQGRSRGGGVAGAISFIHKLQTPSERPSRCRGTSHSLFL